MPGGRGILQDLHRCDVVGVDGGQRVVVHGPAVAPQEVVLGDGDAVDHIQRVARRGDRGHAAHADQAARSGYTGALAHLHARSLSLQVPPRSSACAPP